MKVLFINEEFQLQFVIHVVHSLKTETALKAFNYNVSIEPVTERNCPLMYSQDRKEMLFTVLVKNVIEAAFLRNLLSRI